MEIINNSVIMVKSFTGPTLMSQKLSFPATIKSTSSTAELRQVLGGDK